MERGPGPALLPTPVAQPATALPELAASLSTHLRGCRVQLLQGRQPTEDGSSATAVLLHCDRAFTAVVHLEQPGSLRPLRVGVLSIAEAAAATGGSGGPDASLWAPSRHAVYQTMSSQASAALQHFVQEQPPPQQQQQGSASALELQLLWLCTCSDVFSRKSGTSGLLLQADPAAPGGGLLPPLHRPWQGLGWAQLWQAALNPKLRRAEHVTEG